MTSMIQRKKCYRVFASHIFRMCIVIGVVAIRSGPETWPRKQLYTTTRKLPRISKVIGVLIVSLFSMVHVQLSVAS